MARNKKTNLPTPDIFSELSCALGEMAECESSSQASNQPEAALLDHVDGDSSEDGGVSLFIDEDNFTAKRTFDAKSPEFYPSVRPAKGTAQPLIGIDTKVNLPLQPESPFVEAITSPRRDHSAATKQNSYHSNSTWRSRPMHGHPAWVTSNYAGFHGAGWNFGRKLPPSSEQTILPSSKALPFQNIKPQNTKPSNPDTVQSRYSLRSAPAAAPQLNRRAQRNVDPRPLPSNAIGQNLGYSSRPDRDKRHSSPIFDVLPTPVPAQYYLRQAHIPSVRLQASKRLLVIMDLNGTLLYRSNIRKSVTSFIPRPYLKEFIDYLFQHHHVMVWSSARPQNVGAMCQDIFTREQLDQMIACWGRDTLRLTPKQYGSRVQVYKQLSWVWDSPEIFDSNCRRGEQLAWDQTNTVLLDDSKIKAMAEPHNLIQIPEFVGKEDTQVLLEAEQYLEELKFASDVSAFIRANPFSVSLYD